MNEGGVLEKQGSDRGAADIQENGDFYFGESTTFEAVRASK